MQVGEETNRLHCQSQSLQAQLTVLEQLSPKEVVVHEALVFVGPAVEGGGRGGGHGGRRG